MDSTNLSIDDWLALLAEIGEPEALPGADSDPRHADMVEDLGALRERIRRGDKPDPEQTITYLALLRRAYSLQRVQRRRAG